MSAKAMYNLRETLCTNLDQYARKESLTRNDLDTVNMLTNAVKNLDKITEMEEQGNSYGMGRWNADGSYSNGMPVNYGRTSGRRGSRDGGDYTNDAYDNMENRMRREMNY